MSLISVALYFSAPLILVVLLRNIFTVLLNKHKHGPYPPGPKPLPIIGNMLDLRTHNHGAEYMNWSKKYNSDMVFATALGTNILILNKQEDADELFDRRARIYSDRPLIPMIPLLGWEGMISLIPYGNYWRLCRKICQQHFNKEAAKKYQSIILEKVHRMLKGLLDDPQNLDKHNKMLSVSITMAMMYGYQANSIDDPLIAVADEALSLGGDLLSPEKSFINLLPVLRFIPPWFPGASSRKLAAYTLGLTRSMQNSMMSFVENAVADGTAIPSLVSDFLERQKTIKASEDEKRAVDDVALTTYSGAGDTTMSATATFFYLMAANPNIQKRAQKEIDQVIGSTRLPEFEDRPSLPYIDAIYREVLRWQQSLHLGVPHCLSQDDYYKGYFIPKGTQVIGNIWAMTHDESVYPDPYTFEPERHIDENGQLNSNDRVFAYGYGRRICVGKHVASSILWAIIVSVLACYDIGKDKDEFGNEIEVNNEYISDGLLTHKKPFKCSIKPRASVYKDLIIEKKKG